MYDQIHEKLNNLRLIGQEEIDAIHEANALGRKSNPQTLEEIEQVQTRLANSQLETIEAAIIANGEVDMELHIILQQLRKELQKELLEIQKQGFRNRLSDLEQDLEERIAVIQAYFATTQITQQEFYDSKDNVYRKHLQSQLALVHQYISVAKDPDFLDSLKKKEANLLTKGV